MAPSSCRSATRPVLNGLVGPPCGVTTYTYDANGNQLTIEEPTGDVTTNTWDGENRLVAVEHPDFTVTTYAYNAGCHWLCQWHSASLREASFP